MNNTRGFLYEFFRGTLRLLFVILGSLFFAAMCAGWVEGVYVWESAVQLQQNAHRLVRWIPVWIWVLRVPLQSWETARYLLVPLSAFFMLFMGTILYVRDIYHLPTVRRAFHYVFASLFAFFYPVAYVDSAKIDDEDPDNETNIEDKNLIRAIGGPGFVRIQPGNAVAFRNWHGQQGTGSSGLYFLGPFEMITRVVSLEDQHGHIDEAPATTSDGIRIRLKNIDYRFCVLREEKNRDRDTNPYPFSALAVETMAYSFAVSDKGQDRWHDVVQRTVSGELGKFIGSHDLDYLTAPRRNGQNPRRELRMQLFAAAVRESLRRVGAELQWMDIGHFDIDELKEGQELHLVDQTRTKRWATNLIGDARTIRSFGEAKRLANQELARAEAQAEMIISITDALRNVSFGSDQAETLRHIFLARTAQMLEGLQDGKNGKGSS